MSATCCPYCNHASDDPNAWRLPATHPVDCQGCGKTFSLESGQRRAEEVNQQVAAELARQRKRMIQEEVDAPTAMRSLYLNTPTKLCPFCRSEIDADAQKCPRCQEWLDGRQSKVKTVEFNPGVAGALSFLFPGLGQIYKTQIALGMIWMFLVIAGYLLFIFPGIILHIACIANAASSDPVRVK